MVYGLSYLHLWGKHYSDYHSFKRSQIVDCLDNTAKHGPSVQSQNQSSKHKLPRSCREAIGGQSLYWAPITICISVQHLLCYVC